MNLLTPQCFKFTNYVTKHVRSLNTLRRYRNISISEELKNTHMLHNISSYYNGFNLCLISKFSTTNILSKQKSRAKDKSKVHVDVNALAEVVKLERMTSQLDETIETYKNNLMNYAALRSNVGVIENLPITYEGDEYKLIELVQISRKSNMVVLDSAAFPQIIPNIIDMLKNSHMNLNPQETGTTIYVPIPKVTKEYRENLAKIAKQYFVKCKTAISDVRNVYVKKLKKTTGIPEDLIYNGEIYINTLQQEYVSKAEQMLKAKEKELLGES